MRKVRKFIKSPGLFFRDFLNKRYPVSYNELGCPQEEERVLIKHGLELSQLPGHSLLIDVVFTWVDDRDPVWRSRYLDAKQQAEPDSVALYGTDSARFANHDELRYSLLSVQRFMPWVNRIHIVTDGQCPAWLQTNDKIRIVDHRKIIESRYLPTFNSHVIEAHLHRIPDLAEQFIYFNDDVFVARVLPPGHFFRSNGIASLFLAKKSLSAMRERGVDTPTLSASQRGAQILANANAPEIDRPLVHTYIPLRKSMFDLAWSRHEEFIRTFLPNRFRGTNDLNLASFFVPWLAYLEGLAVPACDICYYFNVRSPAASTHYRELLSKQAVGQSPHSFCANDFQADDKSGEYCQQLQSMLQLYFR